ncbi:MAG: class IV adenylate cyclase [Candidatus Methanomethylicia archaeon]
MFEYEVKICVDDVNLDELKMKLENMGFKRHETSYEEDHYIDFRSCKNYVQDSALRIRISRYNDGKMEYKLTFKGPRISRDVKAREEIEVELKDERMLDVFRKLGFRDLMVKKVREKYSNGVLNVYIDDVKDLGKFLEIEMINPESIEVYMENLKNLLKTLDLKDRELIYQTYLEMMVERSY